MVKDMMDSLFEKGEMKRFDSLATKQAKLDEEKRILVKRTMEKMDSDTLLKVFDLVKKSGHPNEKDLSEKIEKKYNSGEALEFNDLINLDNLYKSNYQKFLKKDVKNE